ncbi:hypothetical protein QVD99_002515 [Batrachochytrium dendrobatidis]|nr:hypothetical protein O5D80_006743 [Batrachochytrium dendrobatidis]KAK5670744.1 hypothetical protein QVD99_002515 [Batrachochytrium dendrobatidis]
MASLAQHHRAKIPAADSRSSHVGYSFTSPHKSFRRFSNNINDYELHEVLGRGGFGVVHRAISRCKGSFGQEIAIKMIDKGLMKAAGMTRRVANEVEIHWQLHHPSILELYNYFEDAKCVYLIMEFCKNGELFAYIHKRPHFVLSEPEARGILMQLVRGLQYMHSNNILHRDLKLSNLLLTHTFDLKLADFGLATRLDNRDGEQKTMCGTPNYISPEIVSRHSYGLETDLWSFGCMIVTILTGAPPFQSGAVKSTLDKASRLEYSLPNSISFEARDLIDKLLQLDPKQRISLSQVLQHPFFEIGKPIVALSANVNVLPRKPDSLVERDPKHPIDTGTLSANNFSTPVAHQCTDHNRIPINSRLSHAIPNVKKPDKISSATSSTIQPNECFSTDRLNPMRQITKHGQVEILPTREILLNFSGDQYIMIISGNSETISLYPRSTYHVDSNMQPARQYSRSSLPTSLLKKFRYAARFVELVRAKTPKIIFYSPQAKCILMENGQIPDFEMIFYSGVRVHTSVSKQTLEIRVPKPPVSKPGVLASTSKTPHDYFVQKVDLSRPDDISLPSDLQSIFKHAQECLRQCLDIDRSGKFDKHTRFPIILKSSHTKHVSSSLSCPDSPSNSYTNPTSHSIHPSSQSAFAYSTPGRSVNQNSKHGLGETGLDSFAPHRNQVAQLQHSSFKASEIDCTTQTETCPSISTQQTLVQPLTYCNATKARSSHRVLSSASDSGISSSRPHPLTAALSKSESTQENMYGSSSSAAGTYGTTPSPLVFLDNIGWCFKQIKSSDLHHRVNEHTDHSSASATSFVVLFCDGARMVVHTAGTFLEFSPSAQDKLESFTISSDLSPNLKTRLGHFAQLIKLFQQQSSQHNSINSRIV